MSPAHETQSMREIRLLRGRLPRKGGGLTGMINITLLSHMLISGSEITGTVLVK